MDYSQALILLKQRRIILDTTINTLESLAKLEVYPLGSTKTERRGRKQMLPQEREIVSARMKQYWATRRNQASA